MATSSRLQLLQARFQQKQLQEKEQKLLQLYDQQQQRAHQVAQRGSAGSNESNGSGSSGIVHTAGNVRQLFEERRKQSNVKGIDKSYPLDPLNGRSKKKPTGQAVNGRRNNAQPAKRGTTRTNGTLAANNNRAAAAVSRESYASSRSSNSYKDSSIQRESFTRESYASSRGDYDEPSASSFGQQLNGHAKRYEINIDEVIDNEAMERNRLLAKFHQVDIERHRHFDVESDDVPGDESYFGSRRSSLDPPRNTAAAAAATTTLKSNNNSRKSNALTAATVAPVTAAVAAAVNATRKPTIPTGARQSTVMKTTKSASLKIRKKVPLSRKTALESRPRSTSLSKINPAKLDEGVMSKSVGSWDREMDWNALKSTSLIFEMIRKASKLGQIGDNDKIGKVKKMVTKIENSIPSTSNANAEAPAGGTELGEKSSMDEQQKRQQQQQQSPTSAITDSDLCKSDAQEAINASASSQEISLRNIESEDQGDGLIQRAEEINLLSIRGKRESSVEQPTEYHEITVANQTIEKREENRPKRVRRASFELKRMMFEQIHNFQRHDSVESALRHFESIGSPEPVSSAPDKSQMDRSTFRLCSRDAVKRNNAESRRGFERHTSAWSIRTTKDTAYRHVKSPVAAKRAFTRRKTTAASKKSSGKKLLEARDSIELARVPVKTKLPACRRKIMLLSNSRPAENDDKASVKSQSSRSRGARVARLKSIFSREPTPKNHDFSPSTTRNSTDSKANKNVAPYPSSKSPDGLSEKSRAPGSLKFLSRLNGSNGELENGFSTAARKSNASAVDEDDEKQSGFVAAAPRTTSSLSSNSSVATSRSHGSTATRLTGKPKAAPPTPAARSTPSSKASSAASNDDSLSTCKICNRRFATDRIGLHEQICAKTSQKKRKQFDAVTHRVKGTELESFVQKPGKKQGKAAAKPAAAVEPSKSNWRRKHEDFINAIRSAKQMQAHLASGGKLSDLPPPPPSDTSDYIQCPHCSRKFNQAAAERHIPKCVNMQHNKPNPRAQPRSRR